MSKDSMNRVPYYPRFQASTGGLGTYSKWIMGQGLGGHTTVSGNQTRQNSGPRAPDLVSAFSSPTVLGPQQPGLCYQYPTYSFSCKMKAKNERVPS